MAFHFHFLWYFISTSCGISFPLLVVFHFHLLWYFISTSCGRAHFCTAFIATLQGFPYTAKSKRKTQRQEKGHIQKTCPLQICLSYCCTYLSLDSAAFLSLWNPLPSTSYASVTITNALSSSSLMILVRA